MTILVTGGCGYIGSHTAVELLSAGHDVVIVDNLMNSKAGVVKRIADICGRTPVFYKADVRSAGDMDAIFKAHSIDAVMHFAGLKAVAESVSVPLTYYDNNIHGATCLLEVMRQNNVKRFVFSSSATVYGLTETVPYVESLPICPINPYGRTKAVIEWMLGDLAQSDSGWSISVLRYFNPVGAHPSGLIGEDPSGIPNNLMPYITQVAVGRRAKLNVFGGDYPTRDGSCIRDYIHVVDLAQGHLAALDFISGRKGIYTHNLGTGHGVSVLELVREFSKHTGVQVLYEITERRPGDLAAYWADASKALADMGWSTRRSIGDICSDAYNFQQKNPHGCSE